jgi:S1-C subfamily serine protease
MEDQNNNNKPEQNWGPNGNDRPQDSPETGSSYHYSYGSFKSQPYNTGQDALEGKMGNASDGNVEITRPEPIKPIPSLTSSGYTPPERNSASNFNQVGSHGGSNNGNNNWQFNQRPKKTSFKTIIAGTLAGMLIMLSGMVYADKQNLFTSNESLSNAAVPASTNTSNATNASVVLPMTKPGDVTNVVNQAGAAVVKIETLVKQSKQSNQSNNPNSNDPFYRYFFGDRSQGGADNGQNNENGNGGASLDQLVPTGIGSGFIFDKSGYILTNEHVVHNADVVQVTLQDKDKPYEAKVLGTSYELDLAVLKIEGDNFPSIPLGNSDNTKVGEWLVAIGNPQGFDHTVTAGVLSAKERGGIKIAGENGEKNREYEHLLQTDASINPGNSGGPLLNLNGEVVGINVAVSSTAQGIGFAIPTSTVNEVLEKLKNNEKIPEKPVPFIGATLMTMTKEVAKQMETDITEGSVVSNVVYNSPAYKADLQPYDIITGADGKKYSTKEELIGYIQKQEVGKEVNLSVVRRGKTMDIKVTIGNKNDFSNLEQ